MRRAIDWAFRNRETGDITIAQWPNVWISGFVVFRVLAAFLDADWITWVARAFLLVWAALEITKGVNPFRRALGVLGLIVVFL